MKTRALSELKSETRDRFSLILVFCPNFPAISKVTTKTAFEKTIGMLDELTERVRDEDAKQWLRVCLQEVRESWTSYEVGELTKGRKLIQRAEQYFDNAFSKKPIEPRFVARESGAALDIETGFPE